MVKNPNWQEADQLAIYKRGRGVELTWGYRETTPYSGQSRTWTRDLRRRNHSTTLPPPNQKVDREISPHFDWKGKSLERTQKIKHLIQKSIVH